MKLVWFTDNRDPVTQATAQYLKEQNWRVALNDLGGKSLPGCDHTQVDLTDANALGVAVKSFGDGLWGVVHPAPPPIHASVEEADDNLWARGSESGPLAATLVTAAAGAHLAGLGRGAIIYLGSIHAEKPMGHGFLYSMGCAATQMLCREAALDYGAKGVHCVYLQRGVMAHDMANQSAKSNLYVGAAFRYPQRRMPDPGSLCGLIEFLLSGAASPLNGADLRADGGYTMYYGNQIEGCPEYDT
ncbi:MAG: SDR family oxidoreductase [Clostridia bacterium]|nr:SDR family oxidoreductase [Clostridia bacterium]